MLLLGRKEGLWGRQSTQQQFHKDNALYTETLPETGHEFDSSEQPHHPLAGQEEHRQKSSILESVNASTRGCPRVSNTLGWFNACLSHAQAACGLAGHHGRNGVAVLKGKCRCSGSCGPAGSQLQIWGSGLLQAARLQRLPEWLRRSSACRQQQDYLQSGGWCWWSSAVCWGTGQMGLKAAEAAFPQQCWRANLVHWAAPAAKSRQEKPKPASAPVASFFVVHRTPSCLGRAILTGRRKGTGEPILPSVASCGLHCPNRCVSDLAIKSPVRLTPF